MIILIVEEHLPPQRISDTMCEHTQEKNHTHVHMKDVAGTLHHLATYDITNVHTMEKGHLSANTQDVTVYLHGQHT